jgi:hypothetical protein
VRLEDFPALYRSASNSSAAAQSLYLRFNLAQFALLLVASSVSLVFDSLPEAPIFYCIAIGSAAAVLIAMATKKPEREWYACRALAESIKTSTWRFMMRAEPFDDNNDANPVSARFRQFLTQILEASRHIQDAIGRFPPRGEQISAAMISNREKTLQERIAFYVEHRIVDQENWYADKAQRNGDSYRRWIFGCVVLQGVTIIFALLRVKYFSHYWPTEPMLLLATAIIGWIQIKKFSELSSAYSLTAHEIGIIRSRVNEIQTENDFSEFVNEAERAFSREHTQWAARQS